MINHDAYSYGQISHAFVDGHRAGELARDEILDNITLYWLTNTAISWIWPTFRDVVGLGK
jgi:hypothetical protein